jgi:hypothetical protein
VKEGWHGREGECTYEKRSVEITYAVVLFLADGLLPGDDGIGTETEEEGIEAFVGRVLSFFKRRWDRKCATTDWTTV